MENLTRRVSWVDEGLCLTELFWTGGRARVLGQSGYEGLFVWYVHGACLVEFEEPVEVGDVES